MPRQTLTDKQIKKIAKKARSADLKDSYAIEQRVALVLRKVPQVTFLHIEVTKNHYHYHWKHLETGTVFSTPHPATKSCPRAIANAPGDVKNMMRRHGLN